MNQEELIDSLWIEFVDDSDGFQGTMSYEAFAAAIDRLLRVDGLVRLDLWDARATTANNNLNH